MVSTEDGPKIASAVTAAGYEPVIETIDIGVGGMTCASCVAHVEKALRGVPGPARDQQQAEREHRDPDREGGEEDPFREEDVVPPDLLHPVPGVELRRDRHVDEA